MERLVGPLRRGVHAIFIALGVLLLLLGMLVPLALLEATGGHDGWLCEWGIDIDGAGGTTSGCG